MNRIALATAFGVVFVVSAVALAPLGVVLAMTGVERLGLSAVSAEGSVWSGRLVGARLGGVPMGDVAVRLEPLALLTGEVRLRTTTGAGAFRGDAVLVRDRDRFGVQHVNGEAPLSLIRASAPLSGSLSLDDVSAIFEQGRCLEASGRVSAPAPPGAGALAAPLSGSVVCRDGALLLPLEGRGPAGVVTVSLAIQGDGRYRAETRVATTDPAVGAGLRLAGFKDSGGAQVRADEGRLWR